jgi:Protein of unknown function (DUF2726)
MPTTTAHPNKTFVPRKLLERLRSVFGHAFAATSDPEIPDLFPYQKRPQLLTPRETAFYQVLLAVVGRRVVISPRVRLADVFSITPTPQHQAFYDRIANRSVDFLLCERYTLKPLLAIELYDHDLPLRKRKKRDPFIDKVFKAGKLPIMHIVAQDHYPLKALAVSVAPHLTMVTYSRDPEPIALGVAPRCPCCGVPMVKRKVISGGYAGREYFSCRNYPSCCERLPLSKAISYVMN